MSQPALDFTDAPPPRLPERRRPLLVGGRGQIARQASADGAVLNAPAREDQCARLLTYFKAQGYRGATDAEIARDLKWPVNVVTARRNDLVADGLVVIRWPNARRRSCTTRVKVVTWVAASAVRTKVQLLGGGPCAKAATGTTPSTEKPRGFSTVVTAGETAAPSPPSAHLRLTRDTIRGVAFGTRVILRDGRQAQMRMVTTAGDAVVFLFNARALETVDPSALIDRRATDGELVEVEQGSVT